jgi:DNA-binding helix-hairpin-helix protein with protein kinase domain
MLGALAALALVACILAVLAMSSGVANRRRLPTVIAQRRLLRQLEGCTQAAASLPPVTRAEEGLIRAMRQRWFEQRLRETSVASLDVAGIGPSMLEALRSKGIQSATDLPLLQRMRVPSIGEKKTELLLSAYRALYQRLELEAGRLTFEQCDQLSGGLISRTLEEQARHERENARAHEAAQIRAKELRRRLRQLGAG